MSGKPRANLRGRAHAFRISFCRLICAIGLIQTVLCFNSTCLFAETHVSFTKPFLRVELSAKEAGRIQKVLVDIGDQVSAGDLLVQLDNEVHTLAQRSAVAASEDDTEVERLVIQLASDREHAASVKNLIKRGAVSPEELREAELKVALAETALRSARNQLHRKALQAKEATERLERRGVKTPVAGVVVELVAKPGEYVSTSNPHLLTLVQLDRLKAEFFLPPKLLTDVRVGDRAQLLSSSGDAMLSEVKFVSPVTEADSGLVRVDVVIDNREAQSRAGQRVQLVEFQAVKQGAMNASLHTHTDVAPALQPITEQGMKLNPPFVATRPGGNDVH